MDAFRSGKHLGAALGLAGPAAAALFLASLLGFSMARTDDYSHGTKAVSELGALGAPWAVSFNVLGFVIPGLLVIVLAAGLVASAQVRLGRAGPVLLTLSGAAMVVAGVFPVDMADRSSTSSILHHVGAVLSGVFWAVGLFWLGPALRDKAGLQALRTLGRATPWFAMFLLTNIAWQVAYESGAPVLPGWGQRVAFLGYFLWLSWAGLALWSVRRNASSTADSAPNTPPASAA